MRPTAGNRELQILKRHLMWLLLSAPLLLVHFTGVVELNTVVSGLFLGPLLVLSLYLLFLGIPYWTARLIRLNPKLSSRTTLIYIIWCCIVFTLLVELSPSAGLRAILALPSYVNGHGLATVIMLLLCAVGFTAIKASRFPPVNVYPFLPALSLIVVSLMPEGETDHSVANLPASGFLVALLLASVAAKLAFDGRAEA